LKYYNDLVNLFYLPSETREGLLQDALLRDRTTARRTCLARVLWQEHSLTREQLIARVEADVGRGCFGERAWEDTFYRDMRVVKKAFQAAGYRMIYRRGPLHPGYSLHSRLALEPGLEPIIAGSLAEIDPRQIAIYRQLSAAERFRLGCSVSDTAREVVAYRIHLRTPHLSQEEALCKATRGAG
jgi:hypothetical protein